MRGFLIGLMLLCSGCAYNQTTINNYAGFVNVESAVDKPVTVDTLRSLGQGANLSGIPSL